MEELDEIVKTAAAGKKSDLAGLITKAEAAVKKLEGDDKDNGALYVKFLQKAQDKVSFAREQAEGVETGVREHGELQGQQVNNGVMYTICEVKYSKEGTRPMVTTMYPSKPQHRSTIISPGNLQNNPADISTLKITNDRL